MIPSSWYYYQQIFVLIYSCLNKCSGYRDLISSYLNIYYLILFPLATYTFPITFIVFYEIFRFIIDICLDYYYCTTTIIFYCIWWIIWVFSLLQRIRHERRGHRQQDRASYGEFNCILVRNLERKNFLCLLFVSKCSNKLKKQCN